MPTSTLNPHFRPPQNFVGYFPVKRLFFAVAFLVVALVASVTQPLDSRAGAQAGSTPTAPPELASDNQQLTVSQPSADVGVSQHVTQKGADVDLSQHVTQQGNAVTTCRGQRATILGTSGPDVLVGTAGNDIIVGRGGADRIVGGGGNDLICAGPGNDRVIGGTGNDYIDGGVGADLLQGGNGNDALLGGSGNDIIRGGAGNDALNGGEGVDELHGDIDTDRLSGGRGDDFLDGGYGEDTLSGGSGFDGCQDDPNAVACEPYWLAYKTPVSNCPSSGSAWSAGQISSGGRVIGASNSCSLGAGSAAGVTYRLGRDYRFFAAGLHVDPLATPGASPVTVTAVADGTAVRTWRLNNVGEVADISLATKGVNQLQLIFRSPGGFDGKVAVITPVGSSVAKPSRPTLGGLTGKLLVGVTGEAIPWNLNEAATFESAVGRKADIVHGFINPQEKVPFNQIQQAQQAGHVVMITLEPWSVGESYNPAYSIITGEIDADLRRWARQLDRLDQPVLLRFMHEMNGNWYPWSVGWRGVGSRNTSAHIVSAYRHAWQIFQDEGATDVEWVWSPNTGAPTGVRYAALYPGDQYVDIVGLDGYNGGDTLPRFGGWKSFREIFESSLDEVARLTDRPVIIAETGSVESGGDKAAWIANMFKFLDGRRDVSALLWFQINKTNVGEDDWRFDSSGGARGAFIRGSRRVN